MLQTNERKKDQNANKNEDEFQPLTEALEAINEDSLTTSQQWKEERWHSASCGEEEISPQPTINEDDPLHSPAIVSNAALNDDNSNSTSGIENGTKEDEEYDEDEEIEVVIHEKTSSSPKNRHQSDDDEDDDDSGHQEHLSNTAKEAKIEQSYALDNCENDALIDANNEHCDDGGDGINEKDTVGDVNDIFHSKIHSDIIGNGTNTLLTKFQCSMQIFVTISTFY